MATLIDIDKTCDLERYVVVINTTGDTDGWADLSKPFDTYAEARAWADKIKGNHIMLCDVPF